MKGQGCGEHLARDGTQVLSLGVGMDTSSSLQSNRLELNEEAVERVFYGRGWTDGLPIIPPTPQRVLHMMKGTDRAPGEVIGNVPPKFGEATIEKIAINAVMAGCSPEHMPVITTALEAMLAEQFNLYGIQTTTHVVAPLIIVNGPLASELKIASGYNCFGQGHRSNAVIGRAIRLVLTNVGGALPGKLDRATFGTPAKYSYVIAENEEQSPWVPLRVELGFSKETTTVTVVGAESPHNVNDHGSTTPEGLLTTISKTLASPGTNNVYNHQGELAIVLSPEHANVCARAGWSKDDVKHFIFDHSQVPITDFSRENIERSILVRWPAWLQERVCAWLADPGLDVRVPMTERWENIIVIVAGGAGKHSLVIPTFGATSAVTRVISLKNGRPARSMEDFAL